MTTSPTMELPTFDGDPLPGMPDEPQSTETGQPVPGTLTGDPVTPYGITAAGSPRRKPGRKPGQPTSKKTAPPPPKKATGPRPAPPRAKTTTDYRPAISEFLGGLLVTPLAIAGLMRNKPVLVADAATVSMGVPAVAEGVNLAAEQFPAVAAILDKVLATGPYAGALSGVVIMAAQLAVNHGMMPPGLVPGTMPPDMLTRMFVEQQINENEMFAAAFAQASNAHAQNATATP